MLMLKWQYKSWSPSFSDKDNIERQLNLFGQEGWEAFCCLCVGMSCVWWLKRPEPPQEPPDRTPGQVSRGD